MVCFPLVIWNGLKGIEIDCTWYNAAVLPSSCSWNTIFSIGRSFVFGCYQRKNLVGVTSTTHSSSGPLGTVSWEKCLGSGVWYKYRSLFYCLFCFFNAHIVTHLHLYCMHIQPIIPIPNLCRPVSGLCVEWVSLAVEKSYISTSKGFHCVGPSQV